MFFKNNDLSFETTTKETKVEMKQKIQNICFWKWFFISNLWIYKNKLFADNKWTFNYKKVEEENKEDNTKISIFLKELKILSKQEERVKRI